MTDIRGAKVRGEMLLTDYGRTAINGSIFDDFNKHPIKHDKTHPSFPGPTWLAGNIVAWGRVNPSDSPTASVLRHGTGMT